MPLLLFCCFTSETVSAETTQETPTDTSQVDTTQTNNTEAEAKLPDFIPITDRWTQIVPPPYEINVKSGKWYDPYNQNKLKGDYPIFGQSTFMILTASAKSIVEFIKAPIPSGVSSAEPFSEEFFGRDRVVFSDNLGSFTFELYNGSTAYKPRDWEIKATGVFSYNYLNTQENNNVNINPLKGDNRAANHFAFEELSFEKHLFNLNRNYDFVSFRGGIQYFASDFRGFVFSDHNLGYRLFGSAGSNKYQYNAIYFNMLEKETNSELNTVFRDRNQDVFIFNLYKQDFLRLGYTSQFSFLYNHDKPSVHNNENGVPVRPALLGNAKPHEIKSYYLGWSGDGHLGYYNVSHAAYYVFGTDDFNSLAGQPVDIAAFMGAFELSIDKDWMRYKISAFYASGDSDPMDNTAKGFDAILDRPFFAGGPFSYWNLVGLRLQNVGLTQKLSPLPSLRSNKFEGQSNFVNPGLFQLNIGYDAEVTPKLKLALNASYLSFISTEPLQIFLNQPDIGKSIGLDYGLGFAYRPFLNNNATFTLSVAALTPFTGFIDIYDTEATQYVVASSLTLKY